MISFRSQSVNFSKAVRLFVAGATIGLTLWLSRRVLKDALIVVAGASVLCFLLDPIANFFERKLDRNLSVLCALVACLLLLLTALILLLPALISEGIQLAQTLPHSIALIKDWLARTAQWLENQFPGLQIAMPSLSSDQLPTLAAGTFRFAGSIADRFYRLSLMVVLSYFFLCDKEKLLILLELLIPRVIRKTTVQMGNAVCRELRIYLKSQGIIAGTVGTLTAAGLAAAGLDSAILLGAIVGILNMIPYFGPLIGAVPAVLTALSDGFQAAAITVAVLWLVQQIDSTLISPRVMSSQTGISPAVVLLAIFVGSGLGGIVGMLFAMPTVMSIRTVFRVFVQRYENV